MNFPLFSISLCMINAAVVAATLPAKHVIFNYGESSSLPLEEQYCTLPAA